ncbi:MAG TPA: CHAT domain-containing tetratricopeptide repeat protein [Bryobacteraceae bacterium]|nr:CHAT domain-containing tetratricopeptide repeat protein [Bryobacteraceae bacterium]
MAALVCVLPSILTAAQCGTEVLPHTPAGSAFQRACDERESGLYNQAISGFDEAARLSRAAHDYHWEAKAQVYKGGVQIRLFQYTAALETTEAAAALARLHADLRLAGPAEVNISTIYALLGFFSLAQQKVEQGINDVLKIKRPDLLSQAYYASSYQQIRLGDIARGIHSSELAINSAREAQRPDLEAVAWDFRGFGLLQAGKAMDAQICLDKAIQIYQTTGTGRIAALTLQHLAELKHLQGQNAAALADLEKAFANPDAQFNSSGRFYPLCLRANILEDLGRKDEALATSRKAVKAASEWRRAALPGDTTNVETVQELDNTYHSFAELAAQQAIMRHDDVLAQEAFEALAENRAATLREELAVEMGRNRSLPPEYLAKLGELQGVQAKITLTNDKASQAHLAELQSQIAEIETRIGLQSVKTSPSKEKSSYRNSLRDIQTSLGSREALLSFCLGNHHSFLWSVTDDTMHLYELPSAHDISEEATLVREALEHKQKFAAAANRLSAALFAQLDSSVKNAPDWLLVGDGALLDRVPFSVLPAAPLDKAPLVNTHTVRLLPSELMLLSRSTGSPQPKFLGVADPLYNLADSRHPHEVMLRNMANLQGAKMLARLPGSQREVRSSAQYSGMSKTELLIGPDATMTNLVKALQEQPELIHFAVHVVSPPDHPEQAALALSLSSDNFPELLTREKISTLRVPGSLVVLSGCSSGQGHAVPSTGLIGLSRAWLLAGASAVIVSNWPTPDDSGQFFKVFYSLLNSSGLSGAHSAPLARRATSALQQAQVEMQRRGGYGSAPGFWAAYSIVTKE